VTVAIGSHITFPQNSNSSFDLHGVLVSLEGKTGSVDATFISFNNRFQVGNPATVQVISEIVPGLANPTVPDDGLPASLQPGVAGGPALMNSDGVVIKGNFTIRIEENYTDLFKDALQFNGGGAGVFPMSPASDVQLLMVFNNIPVGLTISDCSVMLTDSSGNLADGFPILSSTTITSDLPVLGSFFGTALNQDAIDVMWITCATVNAGSATLPLPSTPITMQATLAPVGVAMNSDGSALTSLTQGMVPRYQQAFTNPITVVRLNVQPTRVRSQITSQ
jgi:hypothetical protein